MILPETFSEKASRKQKTPVRAAKSQSSALAFFKRLLGKGLFWEDFLAFSQGLRLQGPGLGF
jgi:hypothetical protein